MISMKYIILMFPYINFLNFVYRMYPLKSIVLVVLICTSLCLSSQSSEEPQARLLVSKQVLNKLLVQNLDILVKVCIIWNISLIFIYSSYGLFNFLLFSVCHL